MSRSTNLALRTVPTLAAAAALAVAGASATAGGTTDGSAGRVQTLSGRFTVPQSLGLTVGPNLYHSFRSLTVAPGESATFTTTTALQNVIARVTGGAATTIEGPLSLRPAAGSRPAFFLVNPAGITVGAGGSVDVPGALHLSTADYLKFADGAVLRSDLAPGSSITTAPPAAFGFLGPRTGTVRLENGAGMTFIAGQSVAIVAGDIEVENATLLTTVGDLRLAAVGAIGTEVGVSGALPALAGRLSILNDGFVGTYDLQPTDTGTITVSTGELTIASSGGTSVAGIAGIATASGQGGAIRVDVAGTATLRDGGQIVSSADQSGRAGSIDVRVGGALTVGANSTIGSFSFATGDAGRVAVSAQGPVVLDGGGTSTTAGSGGIGSETNAAGRAADVSLTTASTLSILGGAKVTASSSGSGAAGRITVAAAEIGIDSRATAGGSGIASQATGSGDAGSIQIAANGALTVADGGAVTSSAYGGGQGGAIAIRAGNVLLDGRVRSPGTGVVSETTGAGHAGSIALVVDREVVIRDGARISSSSFGAGDAGSVRLDAGELRIGDAKPGPDATGILSISRLGGAAGSVDLAVRGLLAIDDGLVSTSTLAGGAGGAVTVGAGRLTIRSGDTGGAGITSNASGTGRAGSVAVTVGQDLAMVHGGTISSSTFGPGDAGTVDVRAATAQLDGGGSPYDTSIASETHGAGRGGAITVAVHGELSIVDQGTITSSAYDRGAAGTVRVSAGTITLDRRAGERRTGIGSVAFSGSGDGGGVEVVADGALNLANGAEISANTATAGAAGSVRVQAERIALVGGSSINSGADAGSSGRTGSVAVVAGSTLALVDSELSIRNDASVARPETIGAGSLVVTAPRISLTGSQITASSTGNVAASTILIDRPVLLSARDGSAINTSAVEGRGGSITLAGAGVLLLDHSKLTTSVTGSTNGDGGPIAIDSRVIVLNSGFVQANTAVAQARGGDVAINASSAGVIVASAAQLITGGRPVDDGGANASNSTTGPNVIQAARPDGVNGDLRIAAPQVDLAAGLATLNTPRLDFGALGVDLCRIGDGSSLTPVGRGAPPPSFGDRLRPLR